MALLNDDEIAAALEAVEGWRREESTIVRDLEFKDFAAAMAFVNEVAALAEERNHHPDIGVHGWNKVRLMVTNHSEGGLTRADFDLAAAIDGLLE
jgi:4a-hydroxytetrahydrobiopterin dehydratase